MTKQRIVASCVAAAVIAAAIAGLAGWVMLLLLSAMTGLGLVIMANEARRRIAKDWHDAQARRPARGSAGKR